MFYVDSAGLHAEINGNGAHPVNDTHSARAEFLELARLEPGIADPRVIEQVRAEEVDAAARLAGQVATIVLANS